MKARLPLILVFIESSLLVAGNSFRPHRNPHCPAQITISWDEEWKNVTTEKYNRGIWSTTLYVHPDLGFKGIRLVAAGDGWLSDASFTLDATCFPGDAQWWKLLVGVWNYGSNNGYGLWFTVWAGDCALWCRRTGYFPDYRAVTVEAHGPSRWRSQYPNRPCTFKGYKSQSLSWINCTYIPITTTTTTTTTPTTTTTTPTTTTTTPTTTITTTTITIIVVSAMIGVGVLVVLVVVMWRFRQRRISKEDVRMRFQGETEVVENSLYETLDNTRRTEVVENSLYETLDNTRRTEVVENSLYETLDNTRRTEVVENSLYETLDNTRRTEVVENSLYETLDNTRRTEVVENSLYEPFENVRKPR
ncbi:uncharacterized protein LOC126993052 isoform X4 [Eriocheir sinensis]|uniref:uncharacterized protein LOC126993052 isoform X4 n=2 Tax=Eriocheir sinensis TaxID=95602 RepID=UPI0021C7BF96|nr:uncharacterized protein LOC126993052 isoform X4 [Eriocheir sinensis]